MPEGPLSGVRIFDLTVAEVGPWASLNLGALGADVIHVEPTPTARGTDQRVFARGGVLGERPMATEKGIQSWAVGYIAWNMNKRGITLDLKADDDVAYAHELLKTCDVFLMNMRPGVADRLGVGYEEVSKLNSRIVYCSVTGFGEDGPMRETPGADPQIRYVTGFAEGTGVAGDMPQGYRFSGQIDATTGNYAAQSILMALLARKRTGKGQRIEITMLNAATALQSVRYGEFFASGKRPELLGAYAQSTAPDGAWLCQDNRYVGIAVTSEEQWHAFCGVIKRLELTEDPRFLTNADRVDHRDELNAILAPIFASTVVEYWELKFGQAGVPCSHVARWSELRHHDQVLENEMVKHVESPHFIEAWTGGPPYHLSGTPQRWFRTPGIGEHNDEVRTELDQLKAQREKGS